MTLSQLLAERDKWLAARAAVAVRGVSYSVGERSLTAANTAEIEGMITRLTRQIIEKKARAAGALNPMASIARVR